MTTRDYEGMFILDNNAATADYDATKGQVDEILGKHGATVVQSEKWDERKLAYDIRGHRRGTYYLAYFRAPPTAVARINEDVELNETVLRHLVLALDEPIEAHIQVLAEERERLAEDSRKQALGGWGDSRRKRDRRSRRDEDGEDGGGDGDEDFGGGGGGDDDDADGGRS
jgi:ribosomal protein S6